MKMDSELAPKNIDFETGEEKNREVATAKAIESLIEVNEKKIPVLTDLTPKNIVGLSALVTFERWLNSYLSAWAENQVNLAETLATEYRLNRISKNRLSRGEIVQVIQKPAEEVQQKGFLQSLRGI